MGTTSPEQNKKLVLQAFDALFNKRDYEAAEKFWSPTYMQHSAHIAPGRDGLFNLSRSLPATLRHENARSGRGRLPHVAWAILWTWATQGVDRRRHFKDGEWFTGRTLGRVTGRGYCGGISEWPPDVRYSIPLFTQYHQTPRRWGLNSVGGDQES
jgi:hypothetical protein